MADPLNLIQVMLAKGFVSFRKLFPDFSPIAAQRRAAVCPADD